MVKSSIIEHQVGIRDTPSIPSPVSLPNPPLTPSDTAESVAGDNQMTLHPKSPPSKGNTGTPQSSKTSAVASTSNAKGLEPYWNESCALISSGLLLPIGIDSPDPAAKLYSSWSNKTVEKSWFSTKLFTVLKKSLPPIFSQYAMSFPVECMDSGNTVIKSQKIEIFPTLEQKQILNRWFGTSRYVYNQAVSLLDNGDTPTTFKRLVPVVFEGLPGWHEETPRQIKVGAGDGRM